MTEWRRLGGLPPFDTTVIRELDSLRRRELLLRLPFLMAATLLLYTLYDIWFLPYWLGLRIAFSIGFIYWARALPERMPVTQLGPFVLFILLDGISYNALAVYLWWLDDPMLDLFALSIIATFMLSVSWLRSDSALLWVCDATAFLITVMSVPVLLYRSGAPMIEPLIAAGVFALVTLYFLMAKWSIWHARAQLRKGTLTEIERAKSDAVGKLSGGMAHDFNNLMTVVLGNLELAKLSTSPGDRAERLEEAERAARRSVEKLGQLLAFSRKARLETRTIDVASILGGLSPLLGNVLGDRHWVTVRPVPDLPSVRVDVGKVQSVLLELVLNARDAMPLGGEILIEAEASEALGCATVSLSVNDRGEGMSAERLAQARDPFFTTKTGATGLGLSMATGIAAQSGGRLEVISSPGEGTRVSILLPAVQRDNAVQKA